MKMIYEHFESIGSLVNALNRPANKVFGSIGKLRSHADGESRFFGTSSYDEALNLIKNGWDEKLDEIKKGMKSLDRVSANVTSPKRRPSTAVVGFAPHVPNAILGLPNSMIYSEEQPQKVKAIRILHNIVVNAGTSSEDIMKAGIAVLNIVNALELKGYRVQLSVLFKSSEGSKEFYVASMAVKDWRQPLDLKKIAFPVAHTSMFRRFGFAAIETAPELTDRSYLEGYGRAISGYGYEREKEILREYTILDDKTYFTSVKNCIDLKFDTAKIAEAAGITALR